MLKLFNTLTRKKEVFEPIHKNWVGFYTCGPTVYNYAHIGNLRTYIIQDVLQRTLEYNNYKVKRVMNITDVGHLTTDQETGEDKIEKRAKKEKKTVWEIIKFYTKAFLKDIKNLNIKKPSIIVPATKTIKDQIKTIKKLINKGFAYETPKAVYFNVLKFKNYNRLSRQPLIKKLIGARKEVVVDKNKRHPADFVLWFKLVDRFKNHIMKWQSPWGKGFPGWHIECSTISTKYLGQPFDIHSGGVDLISPHHENEIAQSEAANNKPFVNYWIHVEHVLVNGQKMSKSLGNFYTLKDLEKMGFDLLAFRYLILTSHYRSKLNFSLESLKAAQNAYNSLKNELILLKKEIKKINKVDKTHKTLEKEILKFKKKFLNAINNDLNTPKTISLLWEIIKSSNLNPKSKYQLILDFDKILGLDLDKIKLVKFKIPTKIKILVKQRAELRKQKKWKDADKIRKKIETLGFIVEDTKTGTILKKK